LFFSKYIPSSSSILPLIDEEQYLTIRNNLQHQPSVKQIQTANSASTVHTQNETCSTNNTYKTSILIANEKRKNKFKNTLIIHCRHEKRLETLKRDLHRIHYLMFNRTPAMDVKMIVGHRNNPDTKRQLTRKRPHMSLLKTVMKTSKYFSPQNKSYPF